MIRSVTTGLALAAVLVGVVALAQPVTFEFPIGEVPEELAGPEAEAVVNACSSCHSLDYLTTQPRGKGAQFWKDSVAKMITVYKAPIAPADAEAVAQVLADTLG